MVGILSAVLAAGTAVAAAQVPAERHLLELDHVYIKVPHRSAADVIAAAGLVIDTAEVTRHEGGGTASISVLFENAYLELLFIDSTVSVTDPASLERMREASLWRPTGPSPFGVGLRRTAGAPDSLPYVGERSRADWIEPGATMFEFPVAQGAPNVFVVPNTIAVPAWIDEIRTDWPAWLSHELGVHQVTAVTIHGSHLPAMPVLGEIKGLSFQDNPEWLLEIQFDEGVRNSTMDLRPGLPLVIVY